MAVITPIVAAVAGSAISSSMSGGSKSSGGAGGGGGYTGYVPNSLGQVDASYVDKANQYLTDAGGYLKGATTDNVNDYVGKANATGDTLLGYKNDYNSALDYTKSYGATSLDSLAKADAQARAGTGNAMQHALDIYGESEGYVPGAQRYRDSAYSDASTIRGYATSAVPYAQQMLQQGFDPQGALRSRETQSLTDSVRAGLAARGIDMGGAGAGIENKALSDFSLDWQDRALGRESTALAGANSTFNNATTNLGAASNLEKSGTDAVSGALDRRIAAIGAGDNIERGAIDAQGVAAARLGAGASVYGGTTNQLLNSRAGLDTTALGARGTGVDAQFGLSDRNQALADGDMANLYRYLSLGTGASAGAADQRAKNSTAIGGAVGSLAGKGWDYFNKPGGSGTFDNATDSGAAYDYW